MVFVLKIEKKKKSIKTIRIQNRMDYNIKVDMRVERKKKKNVQLFDILQLSILSGVAAVAT